MKQSTEKATENGFIVVHEWGKVHTSRIRATLGTFRKKRLFDVRRYYAEDTAVEIMRPTKKGISVAVEDIRELKVAIVNAEKALAEEAKADGESRD